MQGNNIPSFDSILKVFVLERFEAENFMRPHSTLLPFLLEILGKMKIRHQKKKRFHMNLNLLYLYYIHNHVASVTLPHDMIIRSKTECLGIYMHT